MRRKSDRLWRSKCWESRKVSFFNQLEMKCLLLNFKTVANILQDSFESLFCSGKGRKNCVRREIYEWFVYLENTTLEQHPDNRTPVSG